MAERLHLIECFLHISKARTTVLLLSSLSWLGIESDVLEVIKNTIVSKYDFFLEVIFIKHL